MLTLPSDLTAVNSVEGRTAALTVGRLWDKGKNVATLDRAAARLATLAPRIFA